MPQANTSHTPTIHSYRDGDKIKVPGRCSKTGAAIEYRATFSKGFWRCTETAPGPRSALWTGSPSSSAAHASSLAAFSSSLLHNAPEIYCPSCRIRVRNGPWSFICCGVLQCMGSHHYRNGELWVTCPICKEAGTVVRDCQLTLHGSTSAGTPGTPSALPAPAPTRALPAPASVPQGPPMRRYWSSIRDKR